MTPRGTHNAETVLAHVFADTHRVRLGGYSQQIMIQDDLRTYRNWMRGLE